MHQGTFVVPKVVDDGYLALGKERFVSEGAVTYGRHAARRAGTSAASRCTASHGPSPVTSRCLPRGVQTWLLAGLAAFMLLIMFVVGRPRRLPDLRLRRRVPPERRSRARLPGPSAGARVAKLSQLAAQQTAPVVDPRAYSEPSAPPPADPIAEERRRREYESLFASNVVLSRRPESQRPDVGRSETSMQSGMPTAGGHPPLTNR